ncbi:MAG: hypothetical protein ABIQ12_06030 [Opitutaceae bacterium]
MPSADQEAGFSVMLQQKSWVAPQEITCRVRDATGAEVERVVTGTMHRGPGGIHSARRCSW